jgi:hypothetical protein
LHTHKQTQKRKEEEENEGKGRTTVYISAQQITGEPQFYYNASNHHH